MIQIRDLKIGEGKPKICVPLNGTSEREIIIQSKQAFASPADIIEWRADCFEDWKEEASVLRMLKTIRMNIGAKALLFTFRTKEEGGNVDPKEEELLNLYKLVMDSRLLDLVDIECCVSEYRSMKLIADAHARNLPVIGSNHSYLKLLSTGEIDYRIRYMQRLGVDIAKIVVRPERKKEVYKLLTGTFELCEDLELPIAILGQGEAGKYTRILGEFFGSALTWGSLDPSDPSGDIDVNRLATLITNLHEM